MTRRITAHKGGRTARAPEARIRPQTLQRIRATMRERDKSFADLLEETYSGGNETTKRYSFTDLHDNTDAVAAEVISLCKTDTEGIEDWLSAASTDVKATASELAAIWDELEYITPR